MSSLADQLRERIRAEGPIGVDEFMEACNAHYYATRDPLGAAGDFTTAPEISQIFGELVGACLADCWRRAGAPAQAAYAELGPGRGTLAADALRVMREAGFGGQVHFVETSPSLRQKQEQAVAAAHFHERIVDLPPTPLLLVANEFFDALPVRQWVGRRERQITLDGERFAFSEDGVIKEESPDRMLSAHAIGAHVADSGGIAMIIDYGHVRSAPGDTLQAVKGHRFADPLADPGEQDLTAHVDFEGLAHAARASGAIVAGPVPQGEWLRRLGIEPRAQSLIASNPDKRHDINGALNRLCGRDEMGELFKVMAIRSADWPEPAGFAP
jgi:NADH dehydrogenase [ubiquinone] 1 alpha subcomplex assembly factor 7